MKLEKLFLILAVCGLVFTVSCKKEEEEEEEEMITIQPQILRLPIPDDASLRNAFAPFVDPADNTSLMQSFTPSSIKLSISDISISGGDPDDWDGSGSAIYSCEKETSAECMVEVSNLKDFEDSLNAEPVKLAPGTYTKIRVGMCKEINGLQHIEITGTAKLNGVTYRTDTADGIVAGAAADAEPVTFKFGGCAIQIPLSKPIEAELSEEQITEAEARAEAGEECTDCAPSVEANVGVRLMFDAYNFAAMGNMANDATKQLVANGKGELPNYKFNQDDSDCQGDKAGYFICTQRSALFATDDPAPIIERYDLVLTETEAVDGRAATTTPEVTAYTALMLRSDESLIAAYTRRSVNEGAKFNNHQKGDEQYFGVTKNANGSYIFAQNYDGSDPSYEGFKRADHSGTRAGLAPGSSVKYSATKRAD